MAKVLVFDRSCKIVHEDSEEFFKKLDRHLSYQIPGAEFSQAYKGKINSRGEVITWDGRRHILSSKGTFPIGLLPRVIRFYKEHNRELVPEYKKSDPSVGYPIDLLPVLKADGKSPRAYQVEAMDRACSVDRGIVRAATGSGKSLISAMIIAKLGKKAVLYVPGKDLLYQGHKFYEKVFDQEIGIIGDGKCEIHDINVATVWSIGQAFGLKKSKVSLDDESAEEKKVEKEKYRQIKEMLLNSPVHLFDECHLASCETIQTIGNFLKPEHVYGMSASPWRDDNSDLLIESLLGERIIDISADSLISQGYLVPPTIRFIAPSPYPKKTGKYPAVYSKYIIENEERNNFVIQGVEAMLDQGFRPLVLFSKIKHGDILFDKLKKFGCGLLSGKDSQKKRDKVKQDFESNKTNVILASTIFDQGIDIPVLSGLVIASGGKSSVRALQRIGRVVRISPGKTQAAVFDFADQAPHVLNHSLRRKEIYSAEFKNVEWPGRK